MSTILYIVYFFYIFVNFYLHLIPLSRFAKIDDIGEMEAIDEIILGFRECGDGNLKTGY
jgi:hypothetical protein